MKKYLSIAVVAVALCIIAYFVFRPKDDKKFEDNVKAAVSRYTGNVIDLPDTFNVIAGEKVFPVESPKSKYRILTVLGEDGCTSCKMQLREWNELMGKLQNGMEDPEDLELVYVVESDLTSEMLYTIREQRFTRPIFVDKDKMIESKNELPKEVEFRTFLLDDANKVIALGNPIIFDNIARLYANLVGSNFNENTGDLPVSPSAKRVPLGIIDGMKELRAEISIKNTSDSLLRLKAIETSCPCLKATSKYKVIRPKGELDLIIKLQPDEEMEEEGSIIVRSVYVTFENIEEPLILETYAINHLGMDGK